MLRCATGGSFIFVPPVTSPTLPWDLSPPPCSTEWTLSHVFHPRCIQGSLSVSFLSHIKRKIFQHVSALPQCKGLVLLHRASCSVLLFLQIWLQRCSVAYLSPVSYYEGVVSSPLYCLCCTWVLLCTNKLAPTRCLTLPFLPLTPLPPAKMPFRWGLPVSNEDKREEELTKGHYSLPAFAVRVSFSWDCP